MAESIQEVYSATSKFFAEIVNKKDEYVQKRIQDYAKEHAKQFGENVEVLFLDEDKVKQIIQLGIQQYLQREKKLGMTDKEKEAIKEIEYARSFGTSGILPRWSAIETVLNLLESYRLQIIGMKQEIQTQQEEIEKYKYLYQKALDTTVKSDRENIKKDKVIAEMVKCMEIEGTGRRGFTCMYRKDGECNENGCRACIKEYFINKVEKESKDGNGM